MTPRVLRHARTSFVGRADAIAKVAGLLERYHLVTVTGPGGVGKTRLADEVAQRVAGQFADGVCAVELAAIQDPALIAVTVATALGLQRAGGGDVVDAVAARLSGQQLLLLLDNCEHLLDGAAEFCARVLPAADDIRILATSREPLGLPEEARYRLPPLGVPGQAGAPEARGQAVPAQGSDPEAVTLFVERARQIDPELDVDGDQRLVVERLVRRLDGMPLAIELAAARVEALGLAQLHDLLGDRLRLLVSANRGIDARQRSLEATVDWSYRLLTNAEQRAFRFLSVFPGPFTLNAAEAVAGSGARPAVLRLVDCSLLSPPRTGPDGRSRYAMLESLRGFGLDRLRTSGEDETAAAALAAYALAVAEQAADELDDRDQELRAARWLDAEDAALHQGLAWALDHDPPTALRLAVALTPWWALRGRWVEGTALLQRAIARTSPSTSGWYRANVQLVDLSLGTPDYSRLAEQASVVVNALRSAPPSAELVDGLTARSRGLRNMGSLQDALADATSALELARQIRYATGEAMALVELGIIALYADRLEEALAWVRQAQVVDLRLVPARRGRRVKFALPFILTSAEHLNEAAPLLRDVLAEAREAGDLGTQSDLLFQMAILTRLTGQPAEAGTYLREAARLAASIGYSLRLIDVLDEAGLQCAAAHRYAEAVALWAAMAAHNEAIGLADTAESARFRGVPQQEARKALGADRFDAAEKRGAAMALAAALELAIMATSGDTAPAPESVSRPGDGGLSARERELVALVAQGRTDAEIAGQLFISVATVRTHLDRIRDKTGSRRRADLTRLALREGII